MWARPRERGCERARPICCDACEDCIRCAFGCQSSSHYVQEGSYSAVEDTSSTLFSTNLEIGNCQRSASGFSLNLFRRSAFTDHHQDQHPSSSITHSRSPSQKRNRARPEAPRAKRATKRPKSLPRWPCGRVASTTSRGWGAAMADAPRNPIADGVGDARCDCRVSDGARLGWRLARRGASGVAYVPPDGSGVESVQVICPIVAIYTQTRACPNSSPDL